MNRWMPRGCFLHLFLYQAWPKGPQAFRDHRMCWPDPSCPIVCTEEKGLHYKSSLNESVISHIVSKKRSQVRDGKWCYFPNINTYIGIAFYFFFLSTMFLHSMQNVMHTQYVPSKGVPGFIIIQKTFYRKKNTRVTPAFNKLLWCFLII